mgnify:CR=1 FL=1
MSYQLSKLIPELSPLVKYEVHDLFADNAKLDTLTAGQKLTLRVKTSGTVRMVKLVPVAWNIFIVNNFGILKFQTN